MTYHRYSYSPPCARSMYECCDAGVVLLNLDPVSSATPSTVFKCCSRESIQCFDSLTVTFHSESDTITISAVSSSRVIILSEFAVPHPLHVRTFADSSYCHSDSLAAYLVESCGDVSLLILDLSRFCALNVSTWKSQ